ncbi:hypothetical protein SVI_1354 [Shewanella violacea DSS12]|uniref:Uncharacterized protein n=1 Tax=Shewanella violacea (strain JCM 10179 / CIP 106290 / LMG 19151 / DSS12) TaxID=637905 RepID=D4ZI26_SHEVD|nr:hypothetical protein SVI_1354 [Shewanella violacea DSS12]
MRRSALMGLILETAKYAFFSDRVKILSLVITYNLVRVIGFGNWFYQVVEINCFR